MPDLNFWYGTMGSSKTAQALMTKFQWETKGFRVALLKPDTDTRWGTGTVRSRIGLQSPCISVRPQDDLLLWKMSNPKYQSVLVDEVQFLQPKQIDQLKEIAMRWVPVSCYGLKTDFRTQLFPASKRLFEIADHIFEIPSVCRCGRKAQVNARIKEGHIQKEGDLIEIGGEERYVSLCYKCYQEERLW